MNTFQFHHATSVEDAIRKVVATGGKYLAGGTNLVDLMKGTVEQPPALVDLRRLGLSKIVATPQGGVFVEAGISNSAIANHHLIRSQYPVVSQAILSGATTQLRNMATAGGNLLQRTRCPYFMETGFQACNKRIPGSGCAAKDGFNREHALFGASEQCVAIHPSDMAVALAILDAVVHVQGPDGKRYIPLQEFFRLPGDTPQFDNALHPHELILGIELPPSRLRNNSWYLKVRDRHSYAFALVSVAAGLERGEDGTIRRAALALGGVAPMPWRVREAELSLLGKPANDEAFHEAAELALQGAVPLSQNNFKIDLGKHSVVRTLRLASSGPQTR
ncbi:FAD binding domain-containing protein [Terriglobus roseus]|uniref:Xanthine dehydrogenase YagS FAD-binding subunit n=1 Tax=Terriglobus roseus TaxID=392734 RepID=A0A1H4J072_9BACT|nr:xanthine dehydrogenase family protein subunit M [Terriglobus roseus]SEB39653.1 xanthine dehydrogenase YagS FAD-binding subunit [Terriglobus roseus]